MVLLTLTHHTHTQSGGFINKHMVKWQSHYAISGHQQQPVPHVWLTLHPFGLRDESLLFPTFCQLLQLILVGMPYSPPVSQCWSCGTRWVFTKQSHSEFKGQPGEHDKYRIADLTKVISPTSDYDTMIPSAAPVEKVPGDIAQLRCLRGLHHVVLKGGSMICWTMLQDASSRFESSYSMKVNCQSNVCSFGLQHQTLDTYYLVGGFNPSEKYESLLGWLFPIYET